MKTKEIIAASLSIDFSKRIVLTAFIICLIVFQFSYACLAATPQNPSLTPESIRVHHQALVNIASEAGGLNMGIRLNEAGKKAADYIFAEYKKAGLQNVRFEEFYPNRWWPENYSVTVLDGENAPEVRLNAFPLWHCGGVKDFVSDVIYAGFGTSGEFRGLNVKGKIVLIDMKRISALYPLIPIYRGT